ncbi:MAG: ATP-dependent DNA ligase [Candidatus Odinarchaeia archaeon]
MKFEKLCEYYAKIEGTTKRLEMIDLLTSLFKETSPDIIDKVIYLTQGKLHPDWMGLPEIGMAEKMVLDATASALGIKIDELEKYLREKGDLGLTTEYALSKKRQMALLTTMAPLTVEDVYEALDKIAQASGPGSAELKKRIFSGLLHRAKPIEAKYISRIVTGTLRLGIADMTILDALAEAFAGSKEHRPLIERAYNLSSDLGYIASILASKGLDAVSTVKIQVGKPIRMMLAQRLSTPEEILEKLGGVCSAEYKYDGERVQIHKQDQTVQLFSRRLENITSQYPDVCELIRANVKARDAILEGEIVAIDPDIEEMRPFQELMHRRRKYEIHEAIVKYPVGIFLFDILYLDGEDLTNTPYLKRRETLIKTVKTNTELKIAHQIIVNNLKDLEKFFEEAVEHGCEGLVLKSIQEDSVYQAGGRGWLWIKYKRDYKSEIADTIDLVAVGAFSGRGRRAGTYGALLLACYDDERDTFKTVAKVGSGFSDEELENLPKKFKQYIIPHKHPRVESQIEAEIWFLPAIVMEIKGAEITLSPTHTCALNKIKEGSGLAIRFPRFTGRWREDKAPEDATTEREIIELYRLQLKKIS